jgi:5-methylcytosine-specific restriction enzyme subunit McrC
MSLRTVRLVERRAREVHLAAADARVLLEHARVLVDVGPSFRRGFYRLTPRGVVGWFDSPGCRFAIRPKVPWPTVQMLLGLREPSGGRGQDVDGGQLLNVLAREFAERLRETARLGLAPGYAEAAGVTRHPRGKLRLADQLRDIATRSSPNRFHVEECVLDLDTPWNRIARAAGEALLASPGLGPSLRAEVRDALVPLGTVPPGPVSEADFATAVAEPRVAHYRGALTVSRAVLDGVAAARLPGVGPGAFLVNLETAFERWLAGCLSATLPGRHGWSLESQPPFGVGPTTLCPDMLVKSRGQPAHVLDTKWKAPGAAPDPSDLHQVLAYAAVTGARRVGLVYPGRRYARRSLAVPGADVAVDLYRVRVVGTSVECARSVARLARAVSSLRDARGGQ